MTPPPDYSAADGILAIRPEGAVVPYAVEEADAPTPAIDSSLGYSPARVLRALRRRWYAAVPAGMLMAAVSGYLADEFIRADYTARTQVLIAVQQPVVLVDMGGADLTTYQRRQTALVRSRPVLHSALNRPKVADLAAVRGSADPVGWLERDLKADFSVAPEILRITLAGPDPRELVVLLDAIRESYLQEGVNKEVTDKRAALERLRGLIEEDRAKLDEARLSVARKSEEFRAPDAVTARQRHQGNLTRLSLLQTQLFQLDGQVQGWEQIGADLHAHPPQKEAAAPIRPADLQAAADLALSKDSEAQAVRADIARLEPEVIEYRRVAANASQNLKLQEKERDLRQAKERLFAREQAVRAESARRLSIDSVRDFDFRIREYQARVADLKVQIDRTRGQMSSIAAEVKKLDADTLAEARGIAELDRLAGRATEIEDRIKVAKTRAETTEIELRAPPRAQTLEEAVVTQVPNPTKKLRMVAGAVVAGFLGGLLGIAFLDLRAGRIDSPDGVDRHLHTGIVGCIPRVPPSAIAALTRSDGPPAGPDVAALCDATDACRALLLNALLGQKSPVIMVTSAQAGEGKTSLAAQLALSLGRAGYRTLLIDGDLRKPSVHALFGRSQSPGLADVLRKTHAAERIGRRSPLPTLVVMPAGACHPNEAVSLLQLRLGSVLRKCKPFFDVILIDTPPLNLPDAMVIGRHADGTILSLMNEVSTLPATQAACARLRAMNLPLLGAVLNGARLRAPLGY